MALKEVEDKRLKAGELSAEGKYEARVCVCVSVCVCVCVCVSVCVS